MSELPAIPFVFVHKDLSYKFRFLGENYFESADEHKLDSHVKVVSYAKKRAIIMYYSYHLELGLLPELYYEQYPDRLKEMKRNLIKLNVKGVK